MVRARVPNTIGPQNAIARSRQIRMASSNCCNAFAWSPATRYARANQLKIPSFEHSCAQFAGQHERSFRQGYRRRDVTSHVENINQAGKSEHLAARAADLACEVDC